MKVTYSIASLTRGMHRLRRPWYRIVAFGTGNKHELHLETNPPVGINLMAAG